MQTLARSVAIANLGKHRLIFPFDPDLGGHPFPFQMLE